MIISLLKYFFSLWLTVILIFYLQRQKILIYNLHLYIDQIYLFEIILIHTVSILKMEEISLDHGSTQRSNKNLAVEITDAYKAYTKSVDVLKGFNMNVEEGTM